MILQIGNMFKLSAMSRWWGVVGEYKKKKETPPPHLKRFHPRMQMDYSLGLSLLTQELLNPPLTILKPPGSGISLPAGATSTPGSVAIVSSAAPPGSVDPYEKLKIDALSICVYSPDETSNTIMHSPLPQMTPRNHEAYVKATGMNGYFLHTSLIVPQAEAHYSKFMSVLQHFAQYPDTDWVIFIDCDAFFTNFDVTVPDLLRSYNASTSLDRQVENDLQPHFLVAEDTGGINTGVFLVKNSDWSIRYLQEVTQSAFTTAWDQSMFFMALVNRTLWDFQDDFRIPSESLFLHQAHLNAFVPPASRDWQAYEWRHGDYARHFAGCPWQERPCLDKMYETMEFVEAAYGERMIGNMVSTLSASVEGMSLRWNSAERAEYDMNGGEKVWAKIADPNR